MRIERSIAVGTMKEHFFDLADGLNRELRAGETLLCRLSAERSDFVRFNRGKVRQAGSVEQRFLALRIVRGRRHAEATVALSGNGEDASLACSVLDRVRDAVEQAPEDPWLLISDTVRSTDVRRSGAIPAAESVVEQVCTVGAGLDLVGIYAAGTICRGFANSLGQRNWHEIDTFSLDWSLHREGDKVVKRRYAGFDWDGAELERKMEGAARELDLLALPPRNLSPGDYRAWLAPAALEELAGLLCWGGFSLRARRTGQSPLLRMEHGATLAPQVTLTENVREGVAPAFQGDGFVKPDAVTLIDGGSLGAALVSPRSAQEYGVPTNAAGAGESPESLDMAGGGLPAKDALAALDTGLAIGNLWYLNFSDRPAGRVTGMTRFATFWVENGRIVAPVNVMRFDDTIYRMLGEALVDLTRERELLLDGSTYDERSTASMRLPGALLASLKLTL